MEGKNHQYFAARILGRPLPAEEPEAEQALE